ASSVMSIMHGVDILYTNILYFGGGSAAPAIELIYVFCKKLGVELEANMEAVGKIREILKGVRAELKDFDLAKSYPNDFDPLKDTLPVEIDALFDKAIMAAQANDEAALLDACHGIEEYFNFPKPNLIVKNAEVPGGMYSNMVAQLKSLGAEDVLNDAMALIPKVRRDAGLVPLVTPTSQIVGSQAVMVALSRKKGLDDYANVSNQFSSLIKGEYGKTPVAIDPAFREKITGDATEHPYDVSSYHKPENPELPEYDNVKLAQNDEEYLLLELLPSVANTYLRKRRKEEYDARHANDAPTEVVAEVVEKAPVDPITGATLNAPMGGKIISIDVKPGDKVKLGDKMLVYEAMKMENDLTSECDGVVKRLLVAPGDVVATNQPLVEFE
ncbi:MAG: carboxylase, partial [Muribaculaceae bacterium]|nr:carboxylase [Muribaculaceae bacterium]